MKYLFAPATMFDRAYFDGLKELLEKNDIRCVIRNEHLSAGEIPFPECVSELWVLNDDDYPAAHKLIEAWHSATVARRDDWSCAKCGEKLEGQFTSCWRCNAERPGL